MVTINYHDLSLAFDFVSSAAPMEHRAFVSRDSGKVYWISELGEFDEEELPMIWKRRIDTAGAPTGD